MSKSMSEDAGYVRCPFSAFLGRRALAILTTRGMTKTQIARALGVSRGRFYRITTGRSSMYVEAEVMRLADLCGIRTSELMDGYERTPAWAQ